MLLTTNNYETQAKAGLSAHSSLAQGYEGYFKMETAKKDLKELRKDEAQYKAFMNRNGIKTDEDALLFFVEHAEEVKAIKEQRREQQRQQNAGLSDFVDVNKLDDSQKEAVQKRLDRENPLRTLSAGYAGIAEKGYRY